MGDYNSKEYNLRRLKQLHTIYDKEVENGNYWKANQLITKIYKFTRKHFPILFWESNLQGTYRK